MWPVKGPAPRDPVTRATFAPISPSTSFVALDGAYERRAPARPLFSLPEAWVPVRGKTAEDLKLLELVDPIAEALGYAVVRLRLMGGAETRRPAGTIRRFCRCLLMSA